MDAFSGSRTGNIQGNIHGNIHGNINPDINQPMGMKCIKPAYTSQDMTRNQGFTTGNYIAKGNDKLIDKEPQMVAISYNEERCYICNGKNMEYTLGANKQLFGKCKACVLNLKLREYIPIGEYIRRCGNL